MPPTSSLSPRCPDTWLDACSCGADEQTHEPVEPTTLNPVLGLSLRATVALADLPAFFGQAFPELDEARRATGALAVGPPFARYYTAPPAPVDVEAILPIAAPVMPTGRVKLVEVGGGPALQVLHVGPYDDMGPVYEAIARWMNTNGVGALRRASRGLLVRSAAGARPHPMADPRAAHAPARFAADRALRAQANRLR